ncbi:MAG: zinc ribbon domain-containing protein [Lentisphaerae bacterium]|nr:zinc ribbon domain-containing protein [Lentisphaerota bacterium]
MPIYEYICSECGCAFEKLVPRAGTPVECEKCGSSKVEKQFSVFAATTASKTSPCAAADSCPAAGGCGCHGKCGCHH